MKKFLTLLACASILFACDDDNAKPVTFPVVSTVSVTNVTLTSATAAGEVTNSGGADVTERGFVLSTTENPTVENYKITSGTGTGEFSAELTELFPETQYYVRAYAINSKGVAYGDQLTFETEPMEAATLQTLAAEDINFTAAYVGGEITNNGGAVITERGIVWNTTQNPTIENNKVVDEENDGNEFSVALNNLPVGTTIYARAFATNAAGTAYGNQISFMTNALTNSINHFSFSDLYLGAGPNGSTILINDELTEYLVLSGYNESHFGPDRFGNANGALLFDGIDDYASKTNYALDFNGSNELTISLWMKLSASVGDDYAILSIINGVHLFGVFTFDDVLTGLMYGPNTKPLGTAILSEDQWSLMTLVYSEGNNETMLKLYVNGEHIITQTSVVTPALPDTFEFSIGYSQTIPHYFKGSVDDLKIYNTALSADEIAFIYEQEKP